jgi:hypothetical protein
MKFSDPAFDFYARAAPVKDRLTLPKTYHARSGAIPRNLLTTKGVESKIVRSPHYYELVYCAVRARYKFVIAERAERTRVFK